MTISEVIILSFICLVLVTFIVNVKINNLRMTRELKKITVVVENIETRYEQLTAQIDEIRNTNLKFGSQLILFENKIEENNVKLQDSTELNDPKSKLYTRGIKMVELGADIEEIMLDCELSRAEAELIINLNKKKTEVDI